MLEEHSADLQDLLHGAPVRDATQPSVATHPQVLPFSQL